MSEKVTRSNAFVALCKYEENVKIMTFENCDLFKRSFTTQGMGFTFNNEPEQILIKKAYRMPIFSHNVKMTFLTKCSNTLYKLSFKAEFNICFAMMFQYKSISTELFK